MWSLYECVWWVISPDGGPMTLCHHCRYCMRVWMCLSGQRWKENSYAKSVHSPFHFIQRKLSFHLSRTKTWNLCFGYRLQLVRTCARYHQEQKKSQERSKKEKEIHLRHIASTIAREVEFFWSNIEQVCILFFFMCVIFALPKIFFVLYFFSSGCWNKTSIWNIWEKAQISLHTKGQRYVCQFKVKKLIFSCLKLHRFLEAKL